VTFNPVAGDYSTAQLVSISSTTPGVTIYYTTDGSTPTAGSKVYTAAITVSSTQTIKAFATKPNYSDSAVAAAAYTITSAIATPIMSVTTGAFNNDQSVTLSSATAGSSIYYTTDGSNPDSTKTLYSGAITISSTTTLKAIAITADFIASAVASETYTMVVATPATNLPEGKYHVTSHTATLSSSTTAAVIHWTADGSAPTCASATGAVPITASMTIKAMACKTGYSSSAVAAFTYTINSITPLAIEGFPDTTNYPTVTWFPSVKFTLDSGDTVSLFSDTSGTVLNTPTALVAGSNILTATTSSATTQGNSYSVYAKNNNASETAYIGMGSFTAKAPPSFAASGGNATALNDRVNAFAVDGSGNLYAGGGFSTAGGVTVNSVAKWNGSSWSPLGTGMDSEVFALALDSAGNLYAGGSFSTAGGVTVNGVAKWNGSSWSALGTGVSGTDNGQPPIVYTLAIDAAGNLYAGGEFQNAGGVPVGSVAQWDGSTWSAIGNELVGSVLSLAVNSQGDLYAGGDFGCVNINCTHLAKWDGSSWSVPGNWINDQVYALAVDSSGNLYAGGYFSVAGGSPANHVAKWNGSFWSSLGNGVNSHVFALAVDSSGNLYAGGEFGTAGGVPANSIAKWNGSSWSAFGSGVNNRVTSIAIDGSGNLYAGGYFTTVGDLVRPYLAKWMTVFSKWF
jgi:hypothetical protein